MDAGEIRSERPSIQNLEQALAAIEETNNPAELAGLIGLVAELYADSECRCEEKEAAFGVSSSEAVSCISNVSIARGRMVKALEDKFKQIMR